MIESQGGKVKLTTPFTPSTMENFCLYFINDILSSQNYSLH